MIFGILIATFLTSMITSCGSKKILPIPPNTISLTGVQLVSGALSSNVTLVEGSYNLELELKKDLTSQSLIATLNVKIKVKSPIDISSGRDFGPELTPIFLNQNGTPVNIFSSDLFSETRNEALSSSLKNEGEVWVKFQGLVGFFTGEIKQENIDEVQNVINKLNDVKQVVLASTITNPKGSSSVREEKSNTSGSDCEQFLREYEKFVMDYIDILKKYKKNPTDNTILSDYTRMVSMANDWTAKIQDCQNDPTFASKYLELTQRIANAASKLN